MKWHKIESIVNLEELIQNSYKSPQVIFKHSTRCSISNMALNRIQSAAENIEFYYLDIIAFRPISNEIATRFRVEHQSPQLLIINKGECTFHTSHLDISTSVVEKQVGLLI